MRDQVTRMTVARLHTRIRREMISVDLIFRVPVCVCACVRVSRIRVFVVRASAYGTCVVLMRMCIRVHVHLREKATRRNCRWYTFESRNDWSL